MRDLESGLVERAYAEVGVRPFEPTPESFEPERASEGELQAYGYPRRPDAQAERQRHAHWEQMVSRLSMVAPRIQAPPAVAALTIESSNWSGKLAFARSADAVVEVSGDWTVPHVLRSEVDSLLYVCATWVGIDGSAKLTSENGLSRIERRVLPGDVEAPPPGGSIPPNEPSSDVLQAGTTQAVYFQPGIYGGGHWQTEVFPWFQWAPEGPQTITNIDVSSGDVITCSVRALSATKAHILFINQTTGVATSFNKTAMVGQQLVGECAEWVLELPAGSYDGLPFQLPHFGGVYFDNCTASTRKGEILESASGVDVSLTNGSGVGAGPRPLNPSRSFVVTREVDAT